MAGVSDREDGKKTADSSRVYRTAYPARLLRPERLEKLRREGKRCCPYCGSDSLKAAGKTARCLRCGRGFPLDPKGCT